MKAQVITTEYTDICPVQPWQHVVAAAVSQDTSVEGTVPAAQAVSAAPRLSDSDRI